MGTQTTNYSFNKPTIGADDDVWGNDFTGGQDPVADPSPGLNGNWEKMDALLKSLQDQIDQLQSDLDEVDAKAEIPIGGFFLSDTIDDPATTLGYGTWIPWGVGRSLVGVGDNGVTDWTPGMEAGSDEHTLITDEMPVHDHPDNFTTGGAGGHDHRSSQNILAIQGSGGQFDGLGSGGFDRSVNMSTIMNSVPNHTHPINGGVQDAGGDMPHNNVQASKAAYIWKRDT